MRTDVIDDRPEILDTLVEGGKRRAVGRAHAADVERHDAGCVGERFEESRVPRDLMERFDVREPAPVHDERDRPLAHHLIRDRAACVPRLRRHGAYSYVRSGLTCTSCR
jgi:hypothetical protein